MLQKCDGLVKRRMYQYFLLLDPIFQFNFINLKELITAVPEVWRNIELSKFGKLNLKELIIKNSFQNKSYICVQLHLEKYIFFIHL